jgi:protocatechuate 3,4-dioxygenase beta subunit
MINDDGTIGKILSRRAALRALGQTGAALVAYDILGRKALADLSAAVQPKVDLVASPVLTEGPFFVDEKLKRSDLRTDTNRKSVVDGMPLALGLTVYELAKQKLTPMSGATIDVWHADAVGVYSDESNRMNHEDTSHQTWLRGYQLTGDDGAVKFTTIVPGWYRGRAPHLHFKVRQFNPEGRATAEFTSQFFFSESDIDRIYQKARYRSGENGITRNEEDGIYAERLPDGTMAGSRMILKLEADKDSGQLTSRFAVVLTNETLHEGRGRRGPRGRGGPGGPPPDGRPPGPPPEF